MPKRQSGLFWIVSSAPRRTIKQILGLVQACGNNRTDADGHAVHWVSGQILEAELAVEFSNRFVERVRQYAKAANVLREFDRSAQCMKNE